MASIETRTGPRGTSYRVVWYDVDGRKRSKSWRDQTKAEMWKNLIESVRGDEGQAVQHLARQASQAMTVEKVADHRLGLLRGTDYTRQTYQSYMRNHIGPAIGSWPVDTVGEDDCRRFVIALERKGLSPKYIHNICGWLTSIFAHAEERGWRSGNPMKPSMLPEVVRTDDDEADNRYFKDPSTGIVSVASVDTRRIFYGAVTVTKGTAGATPSAPATPAGHIKLAEALVPATAGAVVLTDFRPRLHFGQMATCVPPREYHTNYIPGSGTELQVTATTPPSMVMRVASG